MASRDQPKVPWSVVEQASVVLVLVACFVAVAFGWFEAAGVLAVPAVVVAWRAAGQPARLAGHGGGRGQAIDGPRRGGAAGRLASWLGIEFNDDSEQPTVDRRTGLFWVAVAVVGLIAAIRAEEWEMIAAGAGAAATIAGFTYWANRRR